MPPAHHLKSKKWNRNMTLIWIAWMAVPFSLYKMGFEGLALLSVFAFIIGSVLYGVFAD